MIKAEQQDLNGNLGEAPNDKWKKFFDGFELIKTLPIENWRPQQLIGYFAKKYSDAYGIKYQFKFNSPNPPKSFEVFQIKKLSMILSSDPKILKEYIDWAFQEKVIKGKRRLTSISFITNEDLVNNYKINYLLAGKTSNEVINRSTPLPDNYRSIVSDLNDAHEMKTYGDLAFMHQAISYDDHNSFSSQFIISWRFVLNKLIDEGFDIKLLTGLP